MEDLKRKALEEKDPFIRGLLMCLLRAAVDSTTSEDDPQEIEEPTHAEAVDAMRKKWEADRAKGDTGRSQSTSSEPRKAGKDPSHKEKSSMSNKEEKKEKKLIAIERSGSKIVVPTDITLDDALEALHYRRDREEQEQTFSSPIERAFIMDAAHALHLVLDEIFGYVKQCSTLGFFGPKPPHMMKVPVALGEVVEVPWGRMQLPGIEGYIETSYRETHEGKYELVIAGEVKFKHMDTINKIIEMTREKVRSASIYKGKAFRLRVSDDDGDAIPMPEPVFLDLAKVNPDELIYSQSVMAQVSTNIFTPIRHSDACRKHRIPLKRGILLSGPYGCGKTLCATVTALYAVQNGWTFILCERANDFDAILDMAMEYGPAVVFCEDIDRVLDGERNVDIDDILNTIDGVAAKSGIEVMTILTTNYIEKINQAMLRPGRLDAVIEIAPPDSVAAEKLVRLYARGLLAEDTDLSAVGERLEGQIPAVIREVVERSKLDALQLSDGKSGNLTSEALVQSANSMAVQMKLLEKITPDNRTPIEKGMAVLADALKGGNAHSNGVVASVGAAAVVAGHYES